MISHIAPYRPLYGFRHLLTKRHPFCIYAAYNDLLCCLTIFKTVYYRSASLRQLPDPAKYLRLPERLPLKNLASEDYDIPPAVYDAQRSPFCFRTAVFRSQRPPIFS